MVSGQSSQQRERVRAFTLLELLVVIGIISILLAAVIPAVTSLSKSSGRKGAISNLLGAIEQARAEAIKSGQATYVVFPTFAATSQTTDRYSYKSYAIFADDPANPGTPKQLTNWKNLPTGVSLRSQTSSPESLTNLSKDTSSMFKFTPDSNATPISYYIKFNGNGEVESPPAPPNVTLAVFEGYVNGETEVPTGAKDASGEPAARESITIARLTGRAERSESTPTP